MTSARPAAGVGTGPARDGGLRLVVALLAVYAALHVGFRLLASSSLGEDDPMQNLLVQELRVVYDPRQPPLYDWVLYAVQQVLGPSVASFLALKYAALIGTGALLYLIASRVIGPGLLTLMAVESLALIYQLSWRFHEGFTHQVGTMLAVTATMWAALVTIDRGHKRDALTLGLIVGLGVLTEPIYGLFLLALVLAVAVEPAARHRLRSGSIALAALPAAAIAGIYGWHVAASGADLLAVPALADSGRAALAGAINAARGPLFYLSPLILFLPLLFPGFAKRAGRDLAGVLWPPPVGDAALAGGPAMAERIVLRTSVIGCLLSVAGAALFGIRGQPSHVFMPLYITSVVWLMGAVRRSGPDPRQLARFGQLALAIAVIALGGRLLNMFVLDPVCKICRWGIPYPGLAQDLRQAGTSGATILTLDHELGGNLRAQVPEARVGVLRGGDVVPALARPGSGRVFVVWADGMDESAVHAAIRQVLGDRQSTGASRRVTIPWRHLWRPVGYRSSSWQIMVIDGR